MVLFKYSFWRPTNTLKTWFHENICFCESMTFSATLVCLKEDTKQKFAALCRDKNPNAMTEKYCRVNFSKIILLD